MKYGITAKSNTLGNIMYNVVLKRIDEVLGNLVQTFNISTQTYVEKNDRCTGILAAAAFLIRSKTNRQKCYSLGQLIVGRDIILPINTWWVGN